MTLHDETVVSDVKQSAAECVVKRFGERSIRIGYCLTGSFCTFRYAFEQAEALCAAGAELTPIMSFNAFTMNTRFGTAADNIKKIEDICKRAVISSIEAAEPIGPEKLFDMIIVAPCTGNTIAKLAVGITDTPVTMAVKAQLRSCRPVLLAPATNDALGASGKNISALFNTKGYYFVPYRQDAPAEKPQSMIADFSLLPEAAAAALGGMQLQPLLV